MSTLNAADVSDTSKVINTLDDFIKDIMRQKLYYFNVIFNNATAGSAPVESLKELQEASMKGFFKVMIIDVIKIKKAYMNTYDEDYKDEITFMKKWIDDEIKNLFCLFESAKISGKISFATIIGLWVAYKAKLIKFKLEELESLRALLVSVQGPSNLASSRNGLDARWSKTKDDS